jgi:hypothetical protein
LCWAISDPPCRQLLRIGRKITWGLSPMCSFRKKTEQKTSYFPCFLDVHVILEPKNEPEKGINGFGLRISRDLLMMQAHFFRKCSPQSKRPKKTSCKLAIPLIYCAYVYIPDL